MATNSLLAKTTTAGESVPLTIAAGTSVVVAMIGEIRDCIGYIRKVGSDTSENQIGQLSQNQAALLVTAGADDLVIVCFKPASSAAVGFESDGGAIA